jgi:probable rRNA maturation factor
VSGPDPEAVGAPVPGGPGSDDAPASRRPATASIDEPGSPTAPDRTPDDEPGAALEIELEVDHEGFDEDRLPAGMPSGDELRELVETAAASAGVTDGHVAITIVDPEAIHALNLEHRGKDKPTDVLSFPIDGAGPVAGPREVGDVVICPEHTVSMREAVVHGILHLVGFDHETDSGEMLAVQGQILSWYESHDPPPSPPAGPTAGDA